MLRDLNQIRLQPFYPGQLGVEGSDLPKGLRTRSSGYVLFVDTDHPDADDDNDGTDPNAPLATIQEAVDNLKVIQDRVDAAGTPHEPAAVGSIVVVAPGTYDENVVVDTDDPDYVTILGGGNGKYPVILAPSSGDAITCSAYGWKFGRLHFQPANDGAGLKLIRPATGVGAEGTIVADCFFDGVGGTGLYGVELSGAPANVSILKCRFAEFGTGSGCVTVTDTAQVNPDQLHIFGCTFQESARYVADDAAGGYDAAVIADNVFANSSGDPAATAIFIDMRDGNYNKITRNSLGGDDYAEPGGYYAGTGDEWVGNYHTDTAEGEVGDNGITIDPPAP